MRHQSRRSFLKISGSLIGGLAVGSTAVAATRTDRFVVDTKGKRAAEFERAGLDLVHDLSPAGVAVVEGDESDLSSVTSAYAPDLEVHLDTPSVNDAAPQGAVDEPSYGVQWDKHCQRIPDVHDVTRGDGTRVAVIDSGVAADHPDLEAVVNEDLSRNFTADDFGSGVPAGGDHGTHVAGIIAGNDANSEGIVGSAPATEIVDCRVFSTTEGASFADILAAIVYSAAIGCDAANLSIGAYPIPRQEEGKFYGKMLNKTLTHANSQGTVLVISAGNDAADLQHDGGVISLPNEGAQALSISATGPKGTAFDAGEAEEGPESPSFYTNYGTNAVDLGAPGGDALLEAQETHPDTWFYDLVYSTVSTPSYDDDGNYVGSTNDYGWKAGTSMAAPQVAAAVALVRSVQPNLSANQVKSKLKRTASVPEDYDKSYYGAGFLDPLAAINE
ncbi:peptidase S8 and S53 subtilisin kexin sedolisin [Haloferax mediterranei ATCC 33500]|uniref:Peptidase S8 and S53 subtilisin kexin sedolisin n=1 Tax=Haloferax mediterranei (strain ATCC 33500 / DSM 1411 / JCM 8866 / NBRC 14739 / NCIMB 2177 / R-4) TaxID=523841 RepID=I3R3A2_HALMT|nr:S8 family serine peptidase [Haloferax mediterranei]AFK18712.1 peptidase S8 and S53 subtilisin kexin sedolisin [Haloferax mediterranei ATCC 33500]AHZ21919.1 peptidase S8 and S53 subtilisin kexin sedolisin [Haloferax mediterranei ATCC 33500]EMA03428.1 peptidase S8 and S53 subtilisin kexin sedolisin [Haloferax mediterranei ATCC 33500]MDX5988808.1 S8 family serine peptidase [Haloferax mediterranei ATCC 33500]QCQ75211.1 peptidase S8 and S53 subtilisin kexin sedolisin [Haloferax mediterranei ATCC